MFEQVESAKRRAALKYLLGGSAMALILSVLYPIVRFLIPPEVPDASAGSVLAAKIGEMTPNSGKVFRFGNKPAILLKTPKGELRAFTAVCTHLDCTVQYREDLEHIWCACHNGHYDLNGRNFSGPPPRPLEPYDVNVKGDEIYVTKRS